MFIASILVASLVTAFIIDLVGQSTIRGAHAGNEAREQSESTLRLDSISAIRPNTSSPLTLLDIYVSVPSSAAPLDLDRLLIEALDDEDLVRLAYVDGPASDDEYNATIVRDSGTAFDSADAILTNGDSVKLRVNLTWTDLELSARDFLEVHILPGSGAPLQARFYAPATLGTALRVELY